ALRGTTIGGSLTVRALDEIPILAVAAAFAEGTTTFADAAEARVKESDRLARTEGGLRAMGIDVEARHDGLVIEGRPEPTGDEAVVSIDARGDHRIAMAFAIAGHARGGVELQGAGEVASSYPGFFDDLRKLQGSAA
ncbi:MAG: 3-phosphoshikimate 1-carboxyvinyltransferase, partial [Myxococcota bacterium]